MLHACCFRKAKSAKIAQLGMGRYTLGCGCVCAYRTMHPNHIYTRIQTETDWYKKVTFPAPPPPHSTLQRDMYTGTAKKRSQRREFAHNSHYIHAYRGTTNKILKIQNIKEQTPEVKFLDEIQTTVLRVFLLAIHSHLYSLQLCLEIYFSSNSRNLLQSLQFLQFIYCTL